MHNNIIFIGGIHGVGKGTACGKIQKHITIEHLSASDVLKWSEVSPDTGNKFVEDINDTQERLITGLHNLIEPSKKYILDGHYCLFDSLGKVNPVPLSTFIKISPILSVIVTCDPEVVLKRLKIRDGKEYNITTIRKMQETEIQHAQLVAEYLSIPLIKLNDDVSILVEKIKSL